ncbi:MAG: dihydropteroate synthase [Chromatiales bacterium]|jgi:dihydropteroate synthase|nr:dihydropteroate synthase [Chromatiales bacterium]MDX9766363.1 dihydropteroate synthase [Ectothiorhodospiraceae bacterium]
MNTRMILDCAGRPLALSRPCVMGILNVTPDSFSDGGRFDDPGRALEHALAMVEEGADIIDVGGESTRPGAPVVAAAEELRRVVPVIEALARRVPVPLSVDTSEPAVMRAACGAGACFINDVRALRRPGALEAARDCAVPVCLMHMQGEPQTMQDAPTYDDVTIGVRDWLRERVAACEAAGIPRSRLLLDPGFGFGKTQDHNLTLLRDLGVLAGEGLPVLVGLSRKSVLGALSGRPVGERLAASLAAALAAVQKGACVVRVHDVGATVDALRVWQAVMSPVHRSG